MEPLRQTIADLRVNAHASREVSVELKKGNLIRTSTFYAVRGPGGRWYVDNMDIAAVRDFCGNPGTSRSQ